MSIKDRALAAQGWMTSAELDWLIEQSTGKELVIELGSWCGRSSIALSGAKKLICIDNWKGSKNGAEGHHDFDPKKEFMKNLAPELASGKVEMIVGDLSNVEFLVELEERLDGTADMVFVDACHEEHEVMRDINTGSGFIRDGGLLCGHDYSQAWPGVVAAVNRAYTKVYRAADSIWWIK